MTNESKVATDINVRTDANLLIINQPKIVGGYKMNTMTFCLTKKPSWINRFFVRWCLGWDWEDE